MINKQKWNSTENSEVTHLDLVSSLTKDQNNFFRENVEYIVIKALCIIVPLLIAFL